MSNPGPASTTSSNLQSANIIRLTEAQIAVPSPDILANTSVTYQGPGGVFYQSNGTILVQGLTGAQLTALSAAAVANNGTVGFGVGVYTMQLPNGVDDSAVIQAALNQSSPVIQFQSSATPYILASGVNFSQSGKVLTSSGRSRATIRAAAGTTYADMFTASAGVSDITFDNLVIDANYPNRMAATQGRAVNTSTNLNANFTFRNCRLTGGGLSTFLAAGGDNLQVLDSTLDANAAVAIYMNAATTNFKISRNKFTSWGIGTASSDAIILSGQSSATVGCTGLIQGNQLINTVGTLFAIEGVVPAMDCFHRVDVADNFFYSPATNGGGVSMQIANCKVSDNTFVNDGLASALAPGRNGIECSTQNVTFEGNTIINGGIALGTSGAGSTTQLALNKVVNNTILISGMTAGIVGIQHAGQDDFLIEGNTISVSGTTAGNMVGIGIGNYGTASSTVNRARYRNNVINVSGTSGASAVGIQANQSTQVQGDITIDGNSIKSNVVGIALPSGTNVTNLRISDNDMMGSATPFNGTPTGSGYINAGNKTQTGQTQLYWDAAQAFTPTGSSTFSPNCLQGLKYFLTFPVGGNFSIGNPGNSALGMELVFYLSQNTDGGHAIGSWGANFKRIAVDGTGAANQIGITKFLYDGAIWRQEATALTYQTIAT